MSRAVSMSGAGSIPAVDYHSSYFTPGSKNMSKSFERHDPAGTQYETCRRPRHYCPYLGTCLLSLPCDQQIQQKTARCVKAVRLTSNNAEDGLNKPILKGQILSESQLDFQVETYAMLKHINGQLEIAAFKVTPTQIMGGLSFMPNTYSQDGIFCNTQSLPLFFEVWKGRLQFHSLVAC